MSRSRTNWTLGFVAVVGLAASGCEEPAGIVTSPAPGERNVPVIKEATEPEAIGETGAKGSTSVKAPNISDIPPALPTEKGEVKTTESGVKYETLKEGSGTVAKAGHRVTVHYVGKLDDGRTFDSTRGDGKKPAEFSIGTNDVIKGWDEAVPGMKLGEIRKLTVPPTAAYGAQGRGNIPPNATLIFEIELLNVK